MGAVKRGYGEPFALHRSVLHVPGGVTHQADACCGVGVGDSVEAQAAVRAGLQIVLGAVLKNNPQNAMLVAMALYLVKIGVLLVLLLVLQDATFFAPRVFAAVIVACTLAWTFVEVWVFSRTKVLYVEPEVQK